MKKDKFQRNEWRDAVDSLLLTGAIFALVFTGAVALYGIAVTAGLKL